MLKNSHDKNHQSNLLVDGFCLIKECLHNKMIEKLHN